MSATKHIAHKTAIALANAWVVGTYFTEDKIPNWIEFTVYEKDIGISAFNGKKVKIRMEVEDDPLSENK